MGIVTFIEQSELAWLLLWALALGSALGVFYDVFRIIRRATRGVNKSPVGLALIFLQDVIFFIAAAAASAIFFYKLNSGRVRLSGVLFIVLGFSAYYFTLGRLVMLVADAIINFIKSTLIMAWKFICFIFSPVVRLFKFISSRLYAAAKKFYLRVYTRKTLGLYRKLLNK